MEIDVVCGLYGGNSGYHMDFMELSVLRSTLDDM